MLIAALIGIILLTAADQLIKYWVVQDLKPVGSVPFLHIGDHKILDLTYLENNGAVFSSFAGVLCLRAGTSWKKIQAADSQLDLDSKRRSGQFN